MLDHSAFGGLGAAGGLNARFFHAGAAAHDADDHIIYNRATGAVFYDADGTGGHAAVQFAVLAGKPMVTASDLLVI